MEQTPKTAEEMLNEFPDKYFWDDNRNLDNVPSVEIINLMKRYARQVAQQVRYECADKADVFVDPFPYVDHASILSVDIKQFII